MSSRPVIDAVVVGAGPNGLAAAIELARAGSSVHVIEASGTPGGGTRSAELTLPGFVHDVCSAIHPLGRTSPFFRSVDLERHGLRWIDPPALLAHPLDGGRVATVEQDLAVTAAGLGADGGPVGRHDGAAYRDLFGPLVRDWDRLQPAVLGPFRIPLDPRRAVPLARFGLLALQPAATLARRFRGDAARAVIAGVAAHSQLALTEPISGAAALVLLSQGHADGWPFPAGGTGRLPAAMTAELVAHGGTIETDRRIERIEDLPDHRVALFDVTPRQLLEIAGDRFRGRYRSALERFRYGVGTFKLDIALDGPIPWAADEAGRAGTVHVGGTFEEIARAEHEVARGRVPDRPFVLLAQPSRFDRSRVPGTGETVWAYCHVPNGSPVDMTEPILRQIERFAPGFRDRILAVAATDPAALEAYNANDVGGDITGGRMDLRQLFTRPSLRLFDPYATPDRRIFFCSASTPPGGGIHGMSGSHAARSAAHQLRS